MSGRRTRLGYSLMFVLIWATSDGIRILCRQLIRPGVQKAPEDGFERTPYGRSSQFEYSTELLLTQLIVNQL